MSERVYILQPIFGEDAEALHAEAVSLIGSTVWLILQKKNVRGGVKMGKIFFLAAAVGIIICSVEWIVMLIKGITGITV